MYREQELVEKDNELARAEEKMTDEMEQIRMQQLILDERERDLNELQEKLSAEAEKQQQEGQQSHESEASKSSSETTP